MTPLALALAAGAALGLVFFWGLWKTVDRLPQARRPALWMLVSLLLRSSLVLGGFYFLARDGHWERVLAALLGFVLARVLLIHHVRSGRTFTPSGPEEST
ncbi:MAG: ATP synthase subunit I [Gammaproteobacteria bacterium]|nr:ATP synthase subunit I [Gammaproteobacteria bacterium]NIR83991.1 ATP synthase subunit I [Gammaproteobacteria bacterium]NIR89135.1 ATP synthase subunit I [Gammaproteobacteria bacterium]NIU04937.1 ATP synthase subunit I [Gammaproteobacteria bacterium]NIV52103.1 ATP synthase subunit I [Gammaproteobacteria bacterium]